MATHSLDLNKIYDTQIETITINKLARIVQTSKGAMNIYSTSVGPLATLDVDVQASITEGELLVEHIQYSNYSTRTIRSVQPQGN